MEAKKNEAKQKKTYVKPQVTRVQLTPEEVVLGNCKGGVPPLASPTLCQLCGTLMGS